MGKSSEVNLQADCLVKSLVQDSERPANEGGLPKGGSPLRMSGESCGVKFDWVLKQGLMAFAAYQFRTAIELVFERAIGAVAVWADNMLCHFCAH